MDIFRPNPSPNVIIIGAGPSGVSLAHTLKHKMGFDDFMVSFGPLTRLVELLFTQCHEP